MCNTQNGKSSRQPEAANGENYRQTLAQQQLGWEFIEPRGWMYISIVWHLQAIEVWQASCKRDNVVCPWQNSFPFSGQEPFFASQ